MFQIEAREGDPDERRVTIRHKKTNFGPLMDPFGAKITFEHEKITVEPDELSQADLAEEATVNVSKRILTALEDGPMFPNELQESLGVSLKTVKNRLSELKNAGKVRETGITSGQSQQVELAGVPRVPDPIRDGTGDTAEAPFNSENRGVPPQTHKIGGDTWIPGVLMDYLRTKPHGTAEDFNATHKEQVSPHVFKQAKIKSPNPTPDQVAEALREMDADLTRTPMNLYIDLADTGYITGTTKLKRLV